MDSFIMSKEIILDRNLGFQGLIYKKNIDGFQLKNKNAIFLEKINKTKKGRK